MKTNKAKNFGLLESEFQEMCVQLKQGDESIFEKIFISHFKSCRAYLKSSLRASHDESHDATMNTLLNFRRSLILGRIKYGNLNFLFTQMAYYEVIKNRNQKGLNEDRNLEYYRTASINLQEEEKQSHESLIFVLESLPIKQKELIIKHYYNNMQLNEIAKKEGVPSSTMRKRKERILKTIRTKLSEQIKFRNAKSK